MNIFMDNEHLIDEMLTFLNKDQFYDQYIEFVQWEIQDLCDNDFL